MPESLGTYVKTNERTGKEMERQPTSMTELVALEFDGWRRKERRRKSGSGSSSSSSSSSKPASS